MFRIAICENEKIFANKMKSIVSAYMEEIKLSYEINLYYSGEKFVKLGAEMLNYKVIFLDINMKGLDGLETARIIRKYNDDIFIVFVTAYINYALEGYRFNATRYLLKEKNMFRESVYECLVSIPMQKCILFGNSEHPFPEKQSIPFRSRVQLMISTQMESLFHVM